MTELLWSFPMAGSPSAMLFKRQSDAYQGSAADAEENSPSLSQLYSTLTPVALLALVYVAIWLVLRPRLRRNYAPRSYLGSLPPQERSPELPRGLFNWLGTFNKVPDTYVLNHHSFDGYLLLRFLKKSTTVCFVGCCIIWPVIFPVNATGGGTQTELNIISFGNVQDPNRYYAHALIAWIFFTFVFYMVMRESIFYVNLRQAYLLSPLYASRMSSRTVLFTSVPQAFRDEGVLRRTLGPEVKNVWSAVDCKQLQDLVEERDKIAIKLEAAETKLIKLANKARRKAGKKQQLPPANLDRKRAKDLGGEIENGVVAAEWVKPKQRPSHRLKPIIGKKVDTIDWCRSQLRHLIPEIEALQEKTRRGDAKYTCSAFVEFHTQREAQVAYQTLTHHQPLNMSPRFIGISPEEVIWENLSISWASRIIRNITTTAFVAALIIFWALPVAFVGALSNVKSLSQGDPTTTPPLPPLLPFLGFINDIPTEILGVIQGLLPSLLLAALMALLPIVLRWMARLSGKPSQSSVELRVQNSHFLFQVIQVFLITTITSSASAVAVQVILHPTQSLDLLSNNLPKASNFYISYFILQGLAISSGDLLQAVAVILSHVLGWLLDSTPRKMYNRYTSLSGLEQGTVFPIYTLLTVIAITYSIIAPLVLGFATIGLYLIYLAYRYNLLYTINADIDTKGLVYPRALQQTTTGIYLANVCLIGLFAVAQAWGPLALMVIYLVFAALFHMSLNQALDPLLAYLPKSLQVEEEALLAAENGQHPHQSSDDTTPSSNKEPRTTSPTAAAPKFSKATSNSTFPLVPVKQPRLLSKFLSPHTYSNYHTLRLRVPRDFTDISYDPATERDAYRHPAISASTPVVWIPRDAMGVSRQECRESKEIVGHGFEMTDEMAGFDKRGRLWWDEARAGEAPVGEGRVYW